MILKFYLDYFPGMDLNQPVIATTNPSTKYDGVRRFAFSVDIPDQSLHQIDEYLPAQTAKEVKGEGQ